jgi:hypothetical protein
MNEEPLPALLTAEGAILTDSEQVEEALTALWKPPEGYGRADPTKAATRICAANLIIVADAAERTWISQQLGSLSPRYPTRTIVWLTETRRRSEKDESDIQEVRAWVFALCHVPQPGHPQVCSEQIVLHSSAGDTQRDMLQTILPLLESDIPTMSWWRLPAGTRPSWYRAMASLSDRLVMDAGLGGMARLKMIPGCAVREMGWYRTAHWRLWLAGLFDTETTADLPRLSELQVRTGAGNARQDAVWIAAFLAGQLGWRPVRHGGSEWELAGTERNIRVRIIEDTEAEPGIDSVSLACDTRRYEIARWAGARNAYRIAEHTGEFCHLPRTVEAPRLDAANILASALTGRSTDTAFERAAPIAAWMASALS